MTLFPEDDAPLLKNWIIKRLENTSDADADVLADYVLALLRHHGDVPTVRALCEAEIPDFLKEDSSVFVRDVFDAIAYKLYLPGAAPPRNLSSAGFAPPTGPAAAYGGMGGGHLRQMMGSQDAVTIGNSNRKRSWNDRGDMAGDGNGWGDGRGYQNGGELNGRAYKQPRRAGLGMGRGDSGAFNRGGGSQGQQFSQQRFPPRLPSPPPGMPPFDPNDPMGAILAMQALGFPVLGLPQFSGSGDGVGQSTKQRCRDYDLKGFCSRGSTCPYEHGQDSIYVPPGPVAVGDEYDPTNSSLMTGMENGTGQGNGANPFHSTRGGERARGRGGRGDRGQHNAGRRGGRAEFSSDRPNFDKSKTTIVVENIPEEKFSEDAVREFFSEFGSILEVTMRPYKRLAVVKFDTWDAAKAAYSSPKVIFDNRFVKVYWFTDQKALPQLPAAGSANDAGKNENSSSRTIAPARATSEAGIDIEEFSRKQQDVQKAHEEKLKKVAEMEVARRELEKRQDELLKSQAEEKRKLMEKLAAKSGKSGDVIATFNNGASASHSEPSSQTEALKRQLAALEAEAQSLGIDTSISDESSSWRGRGRGGYRGRGSSGYQPRGYRGWRGGRGGATFGGGTVYKLDNRTKKVSVSGVDLERPERNEALREHLLGVGEFTDLEASSDRAIITFKDRSTAERFMYGTSSAGSEIPSLGKVELAWVHTPLPPVASHPSIKMENQEQSAHDEGDAMTGVAAGGYGKLERMERGEQPQQENLDYDVADDDGWGPG